MIIYLEYLRFGLHTRKDSLEGGLSVKLNDKLNDL